MLTLKILRLHPMKSMTKFHLHCKQGKSQIDNVPHIYVQAFGREGAAHTIYILYPFYLSRILIGVNIAALRLLLGIESEVSRHTLIKCADASLPPSWQNKTEEERTHKKKKNLGKL